MAHSFVQAFDRESDALREFALDHPGTTLLIDTYDSLRAIDSVIAMAPTLRERGIRIGGVRLDSEPLYELSREVRRRLDGAGLRDVASFASGGLDEPAIDMLVQRGAPIAAFGVGSALVCSTDRAALDVASKLVEYAGKGRAKYSAGKSTLPGRKQVFRTDCVAEDILELREGSRVWAPATRARLARRESSVSFRSCGGAWTSANRARARARYLVARRHRQRAGTGDRTLTRYRS